MALSGTASSYDAMTRSNTGEAAEKKIEFHRASCLGTLFPFQRWSIDFINPGSFLSFAPRTLFFLQLNPGNFPTMIA